MFVFTLLFQFIIKLTHVWIIERANLILVIWIHIAKLLVGVYVQNRSRSVSSDGTNSREPDNLTVEVILLNRFQITEVNPWIVPSHCETQVNSCSTLTNKQIYYSKKTNINFTREITYLLESYKPFLNFKKMFSGKKHYYTKLSRDGKQKKRQFINTYIFIYKGLSVHD